MTLGSATAVITIALLRAGSTINLSPGIRGWRYNIVFLKFTAIASSSGPEGDFQVSHRNPLKRRGDLRIDCGIRGPRMPPGASSGKPHSSAVKRFENNP